MKNLFAIVLLLFFTATSFAQSFNEGDKIANLSLGLAGGSYSEGDSSLPPVQGSFEYFIKDDISVGGFLGYSAFKQEGGFGDSRYEIKSSYILLGALANYHFYDEDKINFYGGASLGYAIANSSVTYKNPAVGASSGASAASNALIFGGQVGGRYFFTDQLAANLEVGYGITLVKLGVSYKF